MKEVKKLSLKKSKPLRKLTQKEPNLTSRLTDTVIRNYELRNRLSNKEQLIKITIVLNCNISTLINHEPHSIFKVMQIFDLGNDVTFRPIIEESGHFLSFNNVDFNNYLK